MSRPYGDNVGATIGRPQSLLLEEKVARLLAVTDVVVSLCDNFIVTAAVAAYTSSVICSCLANASYL